MDDLEARAPGAVPVFAERFDEYDERLENATRLEGGRQQAERDGAENEK